MKKIAIVTDTASDLPREWLETRDDVFVLPFYVNFSDRELRDGVDIQPWELYAEMEKEIPKTSVPSAGATMELFGSLAEQGYTDILCLTITAHFSSTWSMINNLREFVEAKGMELHLIDTKTLSMAEGFLVIKAAEMVEEGREISGIIDYIEEHKTESRLFFVLKTLEYLRKGGRIGAVEGTVAEMLSVKPVISVTEDGVYYTHTKARGRKKSVNALFDSVMKLIGDRKVEIAIVQGDAMKEAEELLERVKETANVSRSYIVHVGVALGVNTGPGVLGIAYNFIE